MSLATYSDLRAAIATWAMRDGDAGFEAAVPTFISLAESRFNRSLRVREMEAVATLAPDPDARYPSVTALAADIARFRAGQAVTAHTETVLDRIVRLGRTYRAAILLILGYIVMRVAVAVLAGW